MDIENDTRNVSMCLKPGPFGSDYGRGLLVFNELSWEVVAYFVDTDEIIYHHILILNSTNKVKNNVM
jgi:hypothetical protein